MADETGLTRKEVETRVARLCGELGVIRYNDDTNEVYINRWYYYNWTKSPKTVKAIEKGIKSIKDESFLRDVKEKLYELKNSEKMKQEDPSRVSVTDTDTDSVSDTVSVPVTVPFPEGVSGGARDDSLRLLMRLGAYDDIKELL